MKRKVVKAIALCSVIGALAIGGPAVYLADYGTVKNTFTVGKVDIDLDEPNWTPEDHETSEPTEEMEKDPQITNVGKNDAYVYMEVSVPVREVITANEDGSRNPSTSTEMFSYTKSSKWNLMGTKLVGDNKVYLYNYTEILEPEEVTEPLFKTVTFANIIEGQLDEQSIDIDIRAYAIQTVNTGDKEADVNAQAKAAYNKYVNQNDQQNSALTYISSRCSKQNIRILIAIFSEDGSIDIIYNEGNKIVK